MSAPRMDPIKVDGVLRPDLDFRDIPVKTMAAYLDVSSGTVTARTNRGEIPFVTHGAYRFYQPWKIFARGSA